MTVSLTDDRSVEPDPAPGNRAEGAAPKGELHKSSQFRATLLADRSRHRHRRLVRLVVLLLVAAGAIVAVARSTTASPTAQYRTATASVHDVDQQITGVATIEPVAQIAVAFPASGSVASVDVTVGATVAAGQKLAALDTRQLEVALHNEQASLANAQLALQNALNGTSTTQGGAGATDQRATSSASTSGAPASSGTGSAAPSGDTSSTPAASTNGGTGTTVSAADQYAAQQAVAAAQAEVTVAEQAIAQATITSPIAGTVEAVSLRVGDSVSSGSTTATILIVGAGGVEATTTVGVDNISKIKVGQVAHVRPDGSSQPLDGRVIAISTTPVSTTGTATYRVTIELDGDTSSLGNGSTATASITTATTKATLAVPTSAVTANGDAHTVTILDGTTTKKVDVQIGAIGQTWTAITGGLTDGQTVVLADLNNPLPSAATTATNQTNRNPFTGGGGGGGGGGLPPGGFPGGGIPGGGAGGGR